MLQFLRAVALGSAAIAGVALPVRLSFTGVNPGLPVAHAAMVSPSIADYASHAEEVLRARSDAAGFALAQAWSLDVRGTVDQLAAERAQADAARADAAQAKPAAAPEVKRAVAAPQPVAPRVAPPPPPPAPVVSGSIPDIIRAAFAPLGDGAVAWALRVARCESGYNPHAVGPGPYYGLFQFAPGTWSRTPYAGSSWFDPVANANAAAWLYARSGPGQWGCK
jgi:soluble lytic murein transglycosylase-like protein